MKRFCWYNAAITYLLQVLTEFKNQAFSRILFYPV